MSDGTKFGIATAKATERITFSDAETGEIKACVYPNELRVGLEDSRFRSPAHFRGPIIASRSIIFSDFFCYFLYLFLIDLLCSFLVF